MKTGIVLEGGAVRTIFSTGVCDAPLTRDLLPDYVIGVSAGIAYGVSYVSKQSRRNLDIMVNYINDKRYMGFGNLLRRDNRAYFGLDFVFGTIPNELIPFDYDTFAAYPGEVEAVVTNMDTGKAEYFPVERRDDRFKLLQATCALPFLFPVFDIQGKPCMDGGAADAIPWSGRWRGVRAGDRGADPGAELRPTAGKAPAPHRRGLPEVPQVLRYHAPPGGRLQHLPGAAVSA